MKKNKIKILLAMLVICTSMTACNKVTKDLSSSEIDVKLEKQTFTNNEETEKMELQIDFSPTQKLLDADFNSGLIQIGDEVFDCSEHITVAEMVEKYSNKYEITTVDGTSIDESPYMLERPKFSNNNSNDFFYTYDFNCMLVLRPKNVDTKYTVYATIANLSEEREIKYSEATVLFYEAGNLEITGDEDTDSPSWAPMGFGNLYTKDLERVNEEYNTNSLAEFFKSKGYTYTKLSPSDPNLYIVQILPAVFNETGLIFENQEKFFVCAEAEKSPKGYVKVYGYSFTIDEETNKINNCEMYLENFVKLK
jgi:hypothetical protein